MMRVCFGSFINSSISCVQGKMTVESSALGLHRDGSGKSME